jgi:hypothetical protein
MKRFAAILGLAIVNAGGCARLAVEGGDKPIHIVMDVNIKIDQKLDQFFAFEDQAPATRALNDTTSDPPVRGGMQ